ncbi:MAG: hypothetical protein HY875_13060 [Chloroflexi bacterium]|nr:hypothetical protein [Chloroflexota bacterium]
MTGPRRVVVAEASDPVQAAIWIDALHAAGIEASSFERGVGAALGGAATPGWAVYPVLVASTDIGAARNVVAELAGGAALAPIPDHGAARERSQQALRVAGGAVLLVIVLALLARSLGG